MRQIIKRASAGLLGIALAIALGACGSNDRPDTTSPGQTTTTEAVGS